jgi:hypothetical protein
MLLKSSSYAVASTCIKTTKCVAHVVVCTCAECETMPVANGTTFTCDLPVITGVVCSSQCSSGFEQGSSGATRATCNNGRWNIRGSCRRVTPPPPDVVQVVGQLSVGLSFTGSCTPQATDALVDGLLSDMQQVAATLPSTTASVIPGACSPTSRRRATPVGVALRSFHVGHDVVKHLTSASSWDMLCLIFPI